MNVTVISGQHKGLTGTINGDLNERKKTLGKDGKVMLRYKSKHKDNEILWIRTKHLDLPPLELELG